MARRPDSIPASLYATEAEWLSQFVRFYGTASITRFSEVDLNGVTLVHIYEALASPETIRCEKCDGPGTVCVIESIVGDGELIFVRVQFDSQQMTLTIEEAGVIEEADRDQNSAA